MKHINKKIKDGKLLKVDFEKHNNVITKLKITGDFFIYPEEAIDVIERLSLNLTPEEIKKRLKKYIENKNIKLLGFKLDDLIEILRE